jgi:hypothetical protein
MGFAGGIFKRAVSHKLHQAFVQPFSQGMVGIVIILPFI